MGFNKQKRTCIKTPYPSTENVVREMRLTRKSRNHAMKLYRAVLYTPKGGTRYVGPYCERYEHAWDIAQAAHAEACGEGTQATVTYYYLDELPKGMQ